ncbi:bifunctional Histone-like DNA-binding protein/Integration host factor (IHF)-like DNA-binding domain superfamily [Babesia duncani]|uniref:Bifunctional Histone-like DNA-binding protein/Integration host factor (IHF)-like DNA-binding domain superfamily n=1 Tax=Babesia duncani TaxID=323732 RepID=A0AAD9PLL8_9APIC|nr:bifunctional Histone-like DNA-binding protein/Integration host factor (IHF)-like DNA-binding domain superfamily [Babesia duncani]
MGFVNMQSLPKPSVVSEGRNLLLYAKNVSAEPSSVTKKHLIAEVADSLKKTQKEVGSVVDEFFKVLTKHLGSNHEISIPRFGVFHNSLRGERKMRNLQTGEMFTAKPVYVPSLRFYDALKDEVNEQLKGTLSRGYGY